MSEKWFGDEMGAVYVFTCGLSDTGVLFLYDEKDMKMGCGEQIIKMKGKDADSLVVHHRDNDHFNDDPPNRVTMHFGCHSRYYCLTHPDTVKAWNEAGVEASRKVCSKPIEEQSKKAQKHFKRFQKLGKEASPLAHKGKPWEHPKDCKCPFCRMQRGENPHREDCNCIFCREARGERVHNVHPKDCRCPWCEKKRRSINKIIEDVELAGLARMESEM